MKKINLKGISETLSENELKNVMGGAEAPIAATFDCITSANGGHEYGGMNFSTALAWCDFWSTAGYQCRCYSSVASNIIP
jgi:natural product precursor